jgi:hypothetical protein
VEDGGREVEDMEKRILVPIMMIGIVLLVTGCGKTLDQKGDVSNKDISIPVKVENPSVKELDAKLGAINDEQSAKGAVQYFVDYVDSRIDRSATGMSTSSLAELISKDKIEALANAEIKARDGHSVMDVGVGGIQPVVDIGTVTDTINKLGKDKGIRVDDEMIRTAKVAAESSLPNMNPKMTSTMSPLEAMIISYSLTTGDDGTASKESIKLPIEKAQQFVEIFTQ